MNHKSIFGSFWKNGMWGYRCCHSFVKNSYCLGEEGLKAGQRQVAKEQSENESVSSTSLQTSNMDEVKAEETKKESSRSSSSSNTEDSSSESSSESEDPEKEQEMERERERRKQEARRRERRREKRRRRKVKAGNRPKHSKKEVSESESDSENDKEKKLNDALKKIEEDRIEGRRKYLEGDRKRKYNSTYDDKPLTEAEQEAYKLTAIHSADPMAAYMHEKFEKKARKAGL